MGCRAKENELRNVLKRKEYAMTRVNNHKAPFSWHPGFVACQACSSPYLSASWALYKWKSPHCPAINSNKRRVRLCQEFVNEVFCLQFSCVKAASNSRLSQSPKPVHCQCKGPLRSWREQRVVLGDLWQELYCSVPNSSRLPVCSHLLGCKLTEPSAV